MTEEKKSNALPLAIGGAIVTAGILLCGTKKGKELLQKGVDKAKSAGADIAEMAKEIGDEAVEKGREIVTAGIEVAQEGLEALKGKIEKPAEKPAEAAAQDEKK